MGTTTGNLKYVMINFTDEKREACILQILEDFVDAFGKTKACYLGAACLVCARDMQATQRAQEAIAFLREALLQDDEGTP